MNTIDFHFTLLSNVNFGSRSSLEFIVLKKKNIRCNHDFKDYFRIPVHLKIAHLKKIITFDDYDIEDENKERHNLKKKKKNERKARQSVFFLL